MSETSKYFKGAVNLLSWGLIIVLLSYIIMKTCSMYSGSINKNTMAVLGKGITVDISKGVTNVFTPIIGYISNYSDEEENEKQNALSGLVNGLFPILEYVKGVSDYKFITARESHLSYAYDGTDIEESDVYVETLNDEIAFTTDIMTDFTPDFVEGEESLWDDEFIEYEEPEETIQTMGSNKGVTYSLKSLKNFDFLLGNFYVVDKSTSINANLLDAEVLLNKNMQIKINKNKPQILIYHTHSQEVFIDSKKGKPSETIVGVGSYLTKLLEEYGFNVIHNTRTFDIVDGKLDRNKAYTQAGKEISKIIEDNPSIEVVIDLHRDGINSQTSKLVTKINGKDTAKIMFFNGLSRNKNGAIEYLYNPHIKDNLALSLQLQLKSAEKFPNFTRRIYLKSYRYNLHLLPKSLLVEVGAQTNTLQEAKNAMEPLAQLLFEVLSGG